MSQQTGEACGTGRGACPTVAGIPMQLLLVAGLVLYTAAHGAWSAFEESRRGDAPVVERVEETRVEETRDVAVSPLAAYQEPLRTIVEAAKSGGLAGPSPDAVATIRAAFPEAVARWASVQAASLDAGVSSTRSDRRAALVAAERDALDALARALDAGDARAIGLAGAALEAPFTELVLLTS